MLMQLKDFLAQYKINRDSIKKNPVICFSIAPDGDIPSIFISQFIHLLRSTTGVESLDLASCNYSNVVAQLETSFLGMDLIYWLKSLHELDKKNRQNLIVYLDQYKGPHTIILIASHDELPGSLLKKSIQIPSCVNVELFGQLFDFFHRKKTASMPHVIKTICASYQNITLDQACMVLAYLQVVGKSSDASVILSSILDSEQSLFLLSQNFFSKDNNAFFKMWLQFEHEYSCTFWTTFWSEQLWRAYHVRYFLEKGQQQQAKTMGYRLPFSYLQKDWKKSSLPELKNAHQYMYELDFAFKNNIETDAGIHLFYTKFFLNDFQ